MLFSSIVARVRKRLQKQKLRNQAQTIFVNYVFTLGLRNFHLFEAKITFKNRLFCIFAIRPSQIQNLLFISSKSECPLMINLILFGPPGSGKGTQAAKLIEKYNLLHISTGDLFRYEIGNETPLGLEAKSYIDKGELVPDSVTIGMLRNKVEANPDVAGYIFDGFPRTIPQSEALDILMAEMGQEISKLIMLSVDDEEIVKRLLERGKTSGRKDDADESVIRNRIQVYKENTFPVYDFYAQKGKSVKLDGVGSIAEIADRLNGQIDAIK